MTTWSIYTYGNGPFLVEVFNGVVAIMGDNNFTTLMRIAGLFGLYWVAVKAALFRTSVEWTYLIWFVLIYGVLFVPKVNVAIVDRLDNSATTVVANVPLGLGAFAGAISEIGDWLTGTTEAVMSLPDNLKYQQDGVVFGSNLIDAASQFEITDPTFSANMSEFMHQCVFYDVLLHRYTWKQLLDAPDTWSFIVANTASNSRAFAYTDATGAQQILPCQSGAQNQLTNDWNTEIQNAAKLYGLRYYSGMKATSIPNMSAASAQLLSDLPVSYDYLAGISKSGGDIIQANMMANIFQRSFHNAAAAADAGAAAQDFATAQAEQQQRTTYQVMGNLASKFLPLVKNIYAGLLYGMFPFLFVLFMLPIGVKIFGSYLKNIVWLQLWAPLYAILNLLMTLDARSHSMAAAAQLSGQALSLATHSGLATVNADTAILAGYMGMSIPIIAYGLVSGGQMAMSQFASHVAAVAQSAAQQAASSATTGNISLSNLGAYNTGMFRYDTSPTTEYGTGHINRADGGAVSMARDGATYLSKAGQQLGATLDVGATEQLARTQGLKTMQQAVHTQAENYSHATAAALDTGMNMTRSSGWGTKASDGWNSQQATAYKDMYEHANQIADKMVHQLGMSKTQADRIVTEAYAQAQVGIGVSSSKSIEGEIVKATTGISANASASVGTRITGQHAKSAEISELANEIHNSAQSETVKHGIEALRQYATNHSIDHSQTGSHTLSGSMASDLKRMEQAGTQYTAARSRVTQAESAMQRLSSSDRTGRANLMYEFMQDLQSSGYSRTGMFTGDGITGTGREAALSRAAEEWYVQKYVNGESGAVAARTGAEMALNPGHGQAGTAVGDPVQARLLDQAAQGADNPVAAVNAADQANRAHMPGVHTVDAAGRRYEGSVLYHPDTGAAANGLFASTLGQPPLTSHSDMERQQHAIERQADTQLGAGPNAVRAHGRDILASSAPLNDKVTYLLDTAWNDHDGLLGPGGKPPADGTEFVTK